MQHRLCTGLLSMSSREIAELTGKPDDNVLRDAHAMAVKLYGEGVASFHGPRRSRRWHSMPLDVEHSTPVPRVRCAVPDSLRAWVK